MHPTHLGWEHKGTVQNKTSTLSSACSPTCNRAITRRIHLRDFLKYYKKAVTTDKRMKRLAGVVRC